MEKDAPTGLDHTPFRKYDSGWGRWTSPDPYPGSMNTQDPQSFNRYAYTNNDPVNLTDPSGLLPQMPDATTGWGSYSWGFWGGGWSFNERPSAGQSIIQNAQIRHDVGIDIARFFNWLPPNAVYIGDFTWVVHGTEVVGMEGDDEVIGGGASYSFRPRAGWDNYITTISAEGVARPRSSPRPITLPPLPFAKCFNSYRFSSNFTGTARTIAEAVEVGSEISLAGDAVATAYKMSARSAYIGGTKNRYASGLNFAFRRFADAVRKPGLKGALTKIGNRATPVLAVVGAFTAGYNVSVAVQCGLGVLN